MKNKMFDRMAKRLGVVSPSQHFLECTKNRWIYLEANNGGDLVEIEKLEDNTIHLKSGSSCVTSIDAIVPVEFLTKAIERIMLDNDCDINKVIDSFEWREEYKGVLKGKVKNEKFDS